MSFFGFKGNQLVKLFDGTGTVSGVAASNDPNRILATTIFNTSRFSFLVYQIRCAAPTANMELATFMLSGTQEGAGFEALVTAPNNRNGQISYSLGDAGKTVTTMFVNSAAFPNGSNNTSLHASVGTLTDLHELSVQSKIAQLYPTAWSALYAETAANANLTVNNILNAPFGAFTQMLMMYKPLAGAGPDTFQHRVFAV